MRRLREIKGGICLEDKDRHGETEGDWGRLGETKGEVGDGGDRRDMGRLIWKTKGNTGRLRET